MSETVRALSSEREAETRLIEIAAELAQRKPLDRLYELFDPIPRTISTRKVLKAIGAADDELARLAFEMRQAIDAARAERAAVPAASTCEHCQGNGVIFTHAEDCDDDLCALNGDMHSCVGRLIPCECAAVPASHPPAVPVELAFLRDFVNLCAVGDITEDSDDGLGWADLVRRAKAMLAVSPLASDSVHQSGALRMSGAAAPSGD